MMTYPAQRMQMWVIGDKEISRQPCTVHEACMLADKPKKEMCILWLKKEFSARLPIVEKREIQCEGGLRLPHVATSRRSGNE